MMSRFREKNSNSCVDMEIKTDPNVCRFCLSAKTTKANPFLSPCNCKGSLEFVHLKCLNRWRRIDVVRNGTICCLCLSNYTFLQPFQMEVIPSSHSIFFYCLNYPGLILLSYNYIYSIVLSFPALGSRDYFFLQNFYVVSQYLFHILYFCCFLIEWQVFNKRLYWKQLKTIWTPLFFAFHALLLSLLKEEAFLFGPLLSFYMGLYWKFHIRFLENINIRLHRLENQ